MPEESARFDAVLVRMNYDRKIHVIKLLREITGLGLAEAKHFIEHLPQVVKENVSEEEVWALNRRFDELEAAVRARPRPG